MWGLQRGFVPLRLFSVPQEWGTKGVESNHGELRRAEPRECHERRTACPKTDCLFSKQQQLEEILNGLP